MPLAAYDTVALPIECPDGGRRASFNGPTTAEWDSGEVVPICMLVGEERQDLGPLLPAGTALQLPDEVYLVVGDDAGNGRGRLWLQVLDAERERTLLFVAQKEGATGFGAGTALLDSDECKPRYRPEVREGTRVFAFGQRTSVAIELDGESGVIGPGGTGSFSTWTTFASRSFLYGDTAASVELGNGGEIAIALVANEVLDPL